MTLVNVYGFGGAWSQAISLYCVIRLLAWQEGSEQLACLGQQMEGGLGPAWASQARRRPD